MWYVKLNLAPDFCIEGKHAHIVLTPINEILVALKLPPIDKSDLYQLTKKGSYIPKRLKVYQEMFTFYHVSSDVENPFLKPQPMSILV